MRLGNNTVNFSLFAAMQQANSRLTQANPQNAARMTALANQLAAEGISVSPPPTCFRSNSASAPSPSPHKPGFMGMHAVPEKGPGIYRMMRPMRVHTMEFEHNEQQFTAHISAAGTRVRTENGEFFELDEARKQFGFTEETFAMLDLLSQAKAHINDSQPSVYMEHRLMPNGASWFSALSTNEQRTPNPGELNLTATESATKTS